MKYPPGMYRLVIGMLGGRLAVEEYR